MPTSWKRSREAKLWHRLDPAQATRIMTDCYGEGAGAEVLLRAFLEERDMNPSAVRFWLKVYEGSAAREAATIPRQPKGMTDEREKAPYPSSSLSAEPDVDGKVASGRQRTG